MRYCIWDVGGTIYSYSLNPLNALMERHTTDKNTFKQTGGVKSFDYNPFMRGEQSFTDVCADLCRHCNAPLWEKAIPDINHAFHQGVGPVFPETMHAMHTMQAKGFKNGLLSNALPNLSDTVSLPLLDKEAVFPSYQSGLLKPNAAVFKSMRTRLNCTYDDIIFIDDKPRNVRAACQIGIHGVLFTPATIIKDLQQLTR